MRKGCLKLALTVALCSPTGSAVCGDGPLARLRQRLAPAAARADELAPAAPQSGPADLQALMDVPTTAVRPAPRSSPRDAVPRTAASDAATAPSAAVPSDRPAVTVVAAPGSRPTTFAAPSETAVLAPPQHASTGGNSAATNLPRPWPFPETAATAARTKTAEIELAGHVTVPLAAVGLFEPAAAPPSEAHSPAPTGAIAPQPLPAGATQTSPIGATSVLTLEQAEQMAMASNPTIRQADATAQKAMGTRRQIVRYPNPTIGYNADYIGDQGTAGAQGMFLQQTVMFGGKLELNGKVADWEVQMLCWQAEAQRRRVCNDVRQQYYVTLGAQRRARMAEELQRVADAGAADAEQRFNAIGDLTRVDVVQALVQSREVAIIRANAYVERDAAWQQLAILMGVPHQPYTELHDVLDQTAGPRDLELARQQLLTMNPMLEQARSEVQRASWRIQREEVQKVPNLQLQLIGAHLYTSDSNGVSIQAGLPVPLFNPNDGNVLRAMADYRRACWNVQRLESLMQSQLAAQFQQYQVAANKAAIYRDQILPPLKEAIALIEQNPSTFANLPMIVARRSYFEAQLNELQALVELRKAEVALDGLLLTGAFNELVDNDMDDTNRWNALSGQ